MMNIKRTALLAEDAAAAEDRDEYQAENMFWVPKEARWSPDYSPWAGRLSGRDSPSRSLDKVMLGEPIDLVCGSAMGEQGEGHPWPRLQIFPFTYVRNGTVE